MKSPSPKHLPIRAGYAALFLTALLVNVACSRQPEPEPEARADTPPSKPAAAPPSKPAAAPPDGKAQALPEVKVVWDDPKGWVKETRPRPMRKATYKVPAVKGDTEDAELAVFYFGPGQGGKIEANVGRWAGQFGLTASDLKRTNRSAHGLDQHVIEIESGTYKPDGMGKPADPQKNYGMLAGIVQAPSGPYFFKLIGPSKTITAARPEFVKLLDTVRAAD